MSNLPFLPPEILACYDLGEIQAVEPVPGGIEECFLVTSEQGRLVVKRRTISTPPEALAADHALIAFLVENAFPTPFLIPTRDGPTWIEYNERLYEAHAYIEGAGFTPGDRAQITGVGRVLGRYHALVEGYAPTYRKLPPGGDASVAGYLNLGGRIAKPLEWMWKRHRIGHDEKRFAREVADELRQQAGRFRAETDLVRLVVHGAIEPGNALFDPAGEVAALVDWSDSVEFVRAFDVASALLKFIGRRADAVLPGQVGPVLTWPRVEAFASAYRESILLTEAEGDLLPWLMLALRLGDALWADEKLDINYRYELKMVRELRGWLAKNGAALGEIFS